MRKSLTTFILLFLLFFVSNSFADEVAVFGPEKYLRTKGSPDPYSNEFVAVSGQGTIIIKNGTRDGTNRIIDSVSSASVYVNGVQIFGPRDFNKNVYLLEKIVDLQENNSISVDLASSPGSYIAVEIKEDIDPPTIFLGASSASIPLGESSILTWDSSLASWCTIEPGIGSVDINGSAVVTPEITTTYTITATGLGGSSPAIATIEVVPPPTIAIQTDPQSIINGESTVLTWNSTNAVSCFIEPDVGSVAANGTISVSPTITTSYTITASGIYESATDSAQVVVYDPPTASITAIPSEINSGESAVLSWESTNADICTITPDIGSVDVSGSISVTPSETTIYTISAQGPGGTATNTATLSVIEVNSPPEVQFDQGLITIEQGDSTTLSWTSNRADTIHIDNGIGSAPPNGSMVIVPDCTTTYTIAAISANGSNSDKITVYVMGEPVPLPEGSFGKQYEDIIPPDSTVQEYDPKRFALVTGVVNNIDNEGLQDVNVTVYDHPEYGTVTTGSDGKYSLPVEGGGLLKLVFKKSGYITSHRQINVPWNDFAVAETIQMITEDPISTTIAFDGNSETIITHRSTTVTDESGPRSCTMVFQGDNQAFLVDENGNDVRELSTIITRATEYTTPESMPAVLPPTSAYTYCAELSVDGAARVRFAKPVVIWVNNFLGFAVGEVVPAGYYDRDKGVWIGSDNGMVVELLDVDFDGIVDALDSDGDGSPDDLNDNNSFSDEVVGLGNHMVFLPGATFWRIPVTHFTPWDFNWPYAPPEDAIQANPKNTPSMDVKKCDGMDCSTETASYVEDRSRIMNEDIPVLGTEIMLHYSSDRVKGYKTIIDVPVSGDTVPDSLKKIIVRCEIAGVEKERTLEPLPNQKATFLWDGTDYLGNTVNHSIYAVIRIGFVYDLVYTSGFGFSRAWAQVGGRSTGIIGRQEFTSFKNSFVKLFPHKNMRKENNSIADGWTLSLQHNLNPGDSPSFYKGDGGKIEYETTSIISTIESIDRYSSIMAFDQKGNYYFRTINSISRMDTNGTITVIAGKEDVAGFSGDGGPAVDATFDCIWDIEFDHDGNLFLSDYGNGRVRKIDTKGIITTVAGNGEFGYSGEGGPATDAAIRTPSGIAIDQYGNLFIADRCVNRILKVDTNGIITTIAGDGVAENSGDGGPASQARIGYPEEIEVDRQGNLFFYTGSKIRKIDTSGIINTIAGKDSSGFSGDGGPAVEALLHGPKGIGIDWYGNIYIADSFNNRIRKVDIFGTIITIAGNGAAGFSGDGGPAALATLWCPVNIAVDHQNNIFFKDAFNHRSRKIEFSKSAFLRPTSSGDYRVIDKNGLSYLMGNLGRHKETIDLDTGKTIYTFGYQNFNGSERVITVTDRFGNVSTIHRDIDGKATSIESPDGLETFLTINDENQLEKISYPDETAYHFSYEPGNLLTEKIEPNLNTFNYVYDLEGRVIETFDGNGGHWLFSRSINDNGTITSTVETGEGSITTYIDNHSPNGVYVSEITNPLEDTIIFIQEADGLTTNKSLACGMELEFNYELDTEYNYKFVKQRTETTPGGLTRIIEKERIYEDTNSDDVPDLITRTFATNNKIISIKHNALLSQKVIISPENRTTTIHYNPNTLVTESISVPGLYDTFYGYDTKGRLVSVDTENRGVDFIYNAQGFLETVTDSENNTTSYLYDEVGRVTQINRPDTTSLWFDYDGNGNMTVLTNPSTVDHVFDFNNVNLQSGYATPISGSYSYLYDKDRQLIQKAFPSGNSINFIYDRTRLSQIQTPEGNIDYTYYCGSKVNTITKGSELITYTWDGKLITSEASAGVLSQTIDYTYNNDFNLSNVTYAGNTINFVYDNDGLLTGSGDFTITRNAGNGLPEFVLGGSLSISRTFNGFGEIKSLSNTVNTQSLMSWNLTRNDNGSITNKTQTVNGTTSSYDYTYDSMGRLLTVIKDGSLVEEYQYGVNGSRTYEMNTARGIAGRILTYSDEDHLLNAGDVNYGYNLDGFLSTRTEGAEVTTYDYSSRGELLSVALPDGSLVEYLHDPLGRRIAKKVNGTITEKYLWKGLTMLLAVFDGSDNLLQRFEYADDWIPVSMTAGGFTYYLMYDQVGSLNLVVDASGNVVKQVEYDTFGNILNDSNPGFSVPFGFAGGLHDRHTGIVRFGYRDYDPETGRWTAKDPIFFAGGDMDLYGYVLNDPVNMIDSLGLESFPFQGYVPPVAVTGTVGSSGNFAMTGIEVAEQQYTQLNLTPVVYFYGGSLVVLTGGAAIEVAPLIYEAGVSVLAAAGTPQGQAAIKEGSEFTEGFLMPGTPPPTRAGYAGSISRYAIDKAIDSVPCK